MRIPRFVKSVYRNFLNVPAWLDTKQISTGWQSIAKFGKGVFVPATAERNETFEQAMLRLNLTEADLEHRKKEFTRLQAIYVIAAIIIFTYMGFILQDGFHISGLVCLVLGFYALGQAFRFHFWTFQIKQRKLGCTFKEWLRYGFRGTK